MRYLDQPGQIKIGYKLDGRPENDLDDGNINGANKATPVMMSKVVIGRVNSKVNISSSFLAGTGIAQTPLPTAT